MGGHACSGYQVSIGTGMICARSRLAQLVVCFLVLHLGSVCSRCAGVGGILLVYVWFVWQGVFVFVFVLVVSCE